MSKVFISYKENGSSVAGYFELIEQTDNYVRIKSGANIITLPYHQIIKIKEKVKGGK